MAPPTTRGPAPSPAARLPRGSRANAWWRAAARSTRCRADHAGASGHPGRGPHHLKRSRLIPTEAHLGSGLVRILVVEDEPAIADFIERGLEAEGYAVTAPATATGRAPRARRGVDLVVLDVMLPGQGRLPGPRAIRRDKPDAAGRRCSPPATGRRQVAGLDAGATDYVTKPFSFDELAARVRAHLRTPRQRDATTLEAARHRARPARARKVTRDGRGAPLGARVRPARLLPAPPEPGALARADPERRVGLRLRPGTNVVEVYVRLPAAQARARRQPGADRHAALGRLPARDHA